MRNVMTVALVLLLLSTVSVYAQCNGPSMENIVFTEQEYKKLKEIQESEDILDSIGTLTSWSPLILLAGGRFIDVSISISSTDWENLGTTNLNLLRLRLKTAERLQIFLIQDKPKNKKFWKALIDYYFCIANV